jgi:hypothetical protein
MNAGRRLSTSWPSRENDSDSQPMGVRVRTCFKCRMTWGCRLAVVALLAAAACSGDPLADGACLSARDCTSGQACVSGACVAMKPADECTDDVACGEGRFCDLGTCRDRSSSMPAPDAGTPGGPDASEVITPDAAAGCRADPECGGGQICEQQACVPGCATAGTSLTCSGVDVCNPTTGRCEAGMPACTTDSGCAPPREICEAGLCVPGCAEVGAPACAGDTVCSATTGRCGPPPPPPCANDGACGAPAAVCEAGACTPGCNSVGGPSCGGGTVCNTNTGRCQQVAGPCSMDAQCMAPSSVCESGQCVPGCAAPGGLQCTGSTACNAATGRCDPVAPPPCMADAACNPPSTVCEAGSCVPGCATAGCSGTDVCNTSSGRCEPPPPPPPMCPVDAFEDNDSSTTPTLGVTAGMAHTGLAACAMDDDYYAFDLGVGDQLRAEVLFANADGDIDMQILTPAGTTGVSGSSVNDDEDATYTAAAAGRHLVRVFLYRDQGTNPGNTYTLRLTHTPAPPPPPPPMCVVDRFEDNDSQATARAMTLPVSESGLALCTMDDDYFTLALAAGDEITASVTFSTAEGDIDLRLLDAAGTSQASSTGVTGTESFTFTANAAATYALRVYLYGDAGTSPGAPYSLSVTTRPVCPADAAEENDTQAVQRPLAGPGLFTNLAACNLDDDYYRVTLAAGQAITVNVDFAHAEGDIDLYLLDAAGTSRATSLSVDDDESLTFTPSAAGNYTIRVRLYGDAGARPGNLYTLEALY